MSIVRYFFTCKTPIPKFKIGTPLIRNHRFTFKFNLKNK